MGRWRPRPPPSSPYITAAGFAALELESRQLWEKRKTVVQALAAAAAEGDRSENAEYIYRKELAGIDRRIRYLQKRLPALKVVREFARSDSIFFGAEVELEKESGERLIYRIVGPDETGHAEQYISMDSPLARALLKKGIDDEVRVNIDGNATAYLITGVRYPD